MKFIEKLKFNPDGLIPAIVQEEGTGRVLMMAWMNEASLKSTIETGKTHFWSRSRQKYWMKGESSGHTQEVKDLAFDCDGDPLLPRGIQVLFFSLDPRGGWLRGHRGATCQSGRDLQITTPLGQALGLYCVGVRGGTPFRLPAAWSFAVQPRMSFAAWPNRET